MKDAMLIYKKALLEKYGGRCAYCGKELSAYFDENDVAGSMAIDHIIPTSKGGEDIFENCNPACFACNAAKKDRTLEELRYIKAWQGEAGFVFDRKHIAYLESIGIYLHPEREYKFYFETIK